ncbi:sensor histidine kinase [Prauserella sp. PE36]|nr:sensor histidine kinase [Prauserella sp. PE36]
MLRYWELFYLLVYTGAIVTVWVQRDDPTWAKAASTALLVALGAWYLGHRPHHDGHPELPAGVALRWLAGELVLFLGAIAFVGDAAWVTPAVISQTFWLLPPRFAAPAVVAFSFAPVARDGLLSDDSFGTVVRELGPSAAVFCVMGLLLGYIITKLGEQNERQAQLIASLEASRAEVARLSHEAGTSAERDRLAREIHDTLAQGFTSIVALTQAAESELDTDPPAARRHLELATTTARENLAEARAMVTALTPSALHAGSLTDAVRRQVERFGEETGMGTACEIEPLPRLVTAVEVVLLRATQEALANVRKHADATAVTVRLSTTDSGVRLAVTDDGAGFRQGAAEGFGLRGMRARAEDAGGTLSIHTGRGEGTTVELEVPA